MEFGEVMRPGKKRRESMARATQERPRKPEARRETKPSGDAVAGRNPVVEALRAKIPAKELLIAERAEIDERMSEAIRLAKNVGLPIKEVARGVLDGVTGTTIHQGIALIIKPFQYSPFDQVLERAAAKTGRRARRSAQRKRRACDPATLACTRPESRRPTRAAPQ